MTCKHECSLADSVRKELYAMNVRHQMALEEIARLRAKLEVVKVGATGNAYFAIPEPPSSPSPASGDAATGASHAGT